MAERACRICGYAEEEHGRTETFLGGDGALRFRWIPPEAPRAGPITGASISVCLEFRESPIVEGVL